MADPPGLGSVFDRSQQFSPYSILTFQIATALVGRALLALLPATYRKIRVRRGAST